MLKNHLKIAIRFLLKNRGSSLINLFGLATGMACCLLVSLFIFDETSYDEQNRDADRIYRVVRNAVNNDGSSTPSATTPPALAVSLQKEIPEIEHVVRLFPRGWDNNYYVRYGEKKFIEENIMRADSTLFAVFTMPFVKGDPKRAMTDPHSILLTESMAKKYFGDEDPLGKIMHIDNWQPRVVTAVIRDIPHNTHFKTDFIVTLGSDPMGEVDTHWTWDFFYTYLKLKPGTDITIVDKKIRAIFQRNQPENKSYLYSQPLTSIHLNSHLDAELRPNSDKSYTSIFGIIAFCILLIACINYINGTTALASSRAKDIGIRRITGASRRSLIIQFLTESVILSFAAAAAAIGLSLLLLPAINTITGKQLHLTGPIVFIVLLSSGVPGLLAGVYPALYLSSINPIRALNDGRRALGLRELLIVLQSAISISLIIGTLVIVRQMNFIRQAKLGLTTDQVIIVNDVFYLEKSQKAALKEQLLRIPGVNKVAACNWVPGGQIPTRPVRHKGSPNDHQITFLSVDEDFITALNIQLKDGRDLHPIYPGDTMKEVLLNQAAVKELGILAPVIGKQIAYNRDTRTGEFHFATVVGVVNDFHFASMRTEIKPFLFISNDNREWKYTIRVNTADMPGVLARIKKVWDDNVTSRPFQYTFLDDVYAQLYTAEMNFKKIFSCITFIAIFISCLGLFGLAAYMTGQRTKEIGIRKVLGATVSQVWFMLSGELVRLVVIASLIAFPLAGWMMNSWLQRFAYKISISPWMFALAGTLAVLLTLVTTCFHTIRSATANPVKTLRAQ